MTTLNDMLEQMTDNLRNAIADDAYGVKRYGSSSSVKGQLRYMQEVLDRTLAMIDTEEAEHADFAHHSRLVQNACAGLVEKMAEAQARQAEVRALTTAVRMANA